MSENIRERQSDNEGEVQGQESEGFKFELREANTKEDVDKYLAFADPILGVDWGPEGAPEEYTSEFIAQHPEFTKIFFVQNEADEVVGGAKVKNLVKADKQRLGLDKTEFANRKGVLLEYAAVREDYRKQGMLSALTKKRMDWAKESGADYACTEIEITNPLSTYIKIKEEFKIVGIQPPGMGVLHPYFVLVKEIVKENELSDENQEKETHSEEKEIEIDEDSYQELKKLFSDGWISSEMKFEGENIPFSLILKKEKH